MYLWVIELCDGCNLRCKHCYSFFDGKNILNIEDFSHIINEFKENWIQTIVFSWWEPLLLWINRINEYLKIVKKIIPWCSVNLTTNWTLIRHWNKENAIFREFNHVQISLDWLKETHEKIRWPFTFDKAINAIKTLKEIGVKIYVMMTVSDLNFSEVVEVKGLCDELWVKMAVERITSTWRWQDMGHLSQIQTKELFEFCAENDIKSADPLCNIANQNRKDYLMTNMICSGCSALEYSVFVDSKLDVYPCVRLRVALWNLKNEKLSDISSNNLYRFDRDSLKWKCATCSYKYICWWCRADAMVVDGDLLWGDPSCWLNNI